jgi:hypothetical protein
MRTREPLIPACAGPRRGAAAVRGALLAALLAGCALPAAGQGLGVVEGRLVNGTDPGISAAGVELDVVQLGAGMSIVKSGVTDATGRFRLEGLPTEAPLMVRASYRSVNYHGRVTFDAAHRATVEIPIFETTESMKGFRVEDVRMAFQLDGDHLRVLETLSFVNATEPKRSFMSPRGSFRFAKPEGIAEVPRMTVTSPGSAMPLQQSPLESPDGKSYYSLYGLRPGKTTFEVQYTLPYHERSYTLHKRVFHDLPSVQVGISPGDLALAGAGLTRVHSDASRNFAVYNAGAVAAGAELTWSLAGGTPQSAAAAAETESGESKIKPMPNDVGRNALLIGPLLLMALVAILWYAHNSVVLRPARGPDGRMRALRARRDALLDYVASLDARSEEGDLERREYVRRREQAKRQLRRVAMLLGKK